MKNNFKYLLLIISLLLILTGCTNKVLNEAYTGMKVSKEALNGYTLDLIISGVNGTTKISERLRIRNYMSTKFEITKNISSTDYNNPTPTKEVTYIINGKTYVMGTDKKYTVTTEKVKYTNPSIYLEGLKNATQNDEKTTEKVGTINCDVYTLTFTKAAVEKILKDTALTNVKLTKDATGKVYINKEGYVYRIIYNIDKITINANYFGYDTARDIKLPVEDLNLPNV